MMTRSEELFHQIIDEIHDAIEGKMFGAPCIKSKNGKAVAILWKDSMLFKLDEKAQQDALKLNGATIGAHLYDPDKPMKGWVSLPLEHSDKWTDYTKKALAFVKTLEKT